MSLSDLSANTESRPYLALSAGILKVESHFPLTYLKKSSPGFTEEFICAVSTPNVPKAAFAAAGGGEGFSESHPDSRTNNKTIVSRSRCIKAPQNRLGSKEKFARDPEEGRRLPSPDHAESEAA